MMFGNSAACIKAVDPMSYVRLGGIIRTGVGAQG